MAEQDEQVMEQMRRMVDRTIQRNLKGLEFARAGKAEVGTTPKDLIYDRGTLKLFHYRPVADEIYRVPIIIVMATTNKGFLFDLAPGQSMIEFLINKGYDVYMIDWDPPLAQERGLTLASYTHDFLPTCVNKVMDDCGEQDVSIIGYCQGGVLSLIYAATNPDGPLKNLVCLTTPVNFHGMGLMRLWSDERYLDIDKLVDTLGIIPADFIASSFEMLRPASRSAGRMRVWEQMWNDDFVKSYRAFERWGNETLPLAGEYYRETTRELMWGNKLYTGELVVNGESAKLKNITIPIMHAIAQHDHIAPYDATKPLLELVGSEDKNELTLKGGHVSLIAGPNAVRRMWPNVDAWLGVRSV